METVLAWTVVSFAIVYKIWKIYNVHNQSSKSISKFKAALIAKERTDWKRRNELEHLWKIN